VNDEPLRFKKASFSGGQGECVEIGHSLRHLRDSKRPTGPMLEVDVPALIAAVKTGRLDG
jgi:hypothetical protein